MINGATYFKQNLTGWQSLYLYFLLSTTICSLLALVSGFLSLAINQFSEKKAEYECGFEPFDSATRLPFEVHFYLVGILFLVFDVEIVVLLPWVVAQHIITWFGFFAREFFISLLTVGFAFEWKRGALVWPTRTSEASFANSTPRGKPIKFAKNSTDNLHTVNVKTKEIASNNKNLESQKSKSPQPAVDNKHVNGRIDEPKTDDDKKKEIEGPKIPDDEEKKEVEGPKIPDDEEIKKKARAYLRRKRRNFYRRYLRAKRSLDKWALRHDFKENGKITRRGWKVLARILGSFIALLSFLFVVHFTEAGVLEVKNWLAREADEVFQRIKEIQDKIDAEIIKQQEIIDEAQKKKDMREQATNDEIQKKDDEIQKKNKADARDARKAIRKADKEAKNLAHFKKSWETITRDATFAGQERHYCPTHQFDRRCDSWWRRHGSVFSLQFFVWLLSFIVVASRSLLQSRITFVKSNWKILLVTLAVLLLAYAAYYTGVAVAVWVWVQKRCGWGPRGSIFNGWQKLLTSLFILTFIKDKAKKTFVDTKLFLTKHGLMENGKISLRGWKFAFGLTTTLLIFVYTVISFNNLYWEHFARAAAAADRWNFPKLAAYLHTWRDACEDADKKITTVKTKEVVNRVRCLLKDPSCCPWWWPRGIIFDLTFFVWLLTLVGLISKSLLQPKSSFVKSNSKILLVTLAVLLLAYAVYYTGVAVDVWVWVQKRCGWGPRGSIFNGWQKLLASLFILTFIKDKAKKTFVHTKLFLTKHGLMENGKISLRGWKFAFGLMTTLLIFVYTVISFNNLYWEHFAYAAAVADRWNFPKLAEYLYTWRYACEDVEKVTAVNIEEVENRIRCLMNDPWCWRWWWPRGIIFYLTFFVWLLTLVGLISKSLLQPKSSFVKSNSKILLVTLAVLLLAYAVYYTGVAVDVWVWVQKRCGWGLEIFLYVNSVGCVNLLIAFFFFSVRVRVAVFIRHPKVLIACVSAAQEPLHAFKVELQSLCVWNAGYIIWLSFKLLLQIPHAFSLAFITIFLGRRSKITANEIRKRFNRFLLFFCSALLFYTLWNFTSGHAFKILLPIFTHFLSVTVFKAQNPIHGLISLITVFFNTSIIFIYAGAEFIALVTLIVYVGAISILFLFVIRLLNIQELRASSKKRFSVTELILCGVLIFPAGETHGKYVTSLSTELLNRSAALLKSAEASVEALRYYVSWGFTDIMRLSSLLFTYFVILFLKTTLRLLTSRLGGIILATRT